MHGLETTDKLNTEETIKRAIERARDAGVSLTREQVLDHLRFREDDDLSQWEKMVDAMLKRESVERSYQCRVAA